MVSVLPSSSLSLLVVVKHSHRVSKRLWTTSVVLKDDKSKHEDPSWLSNVKTWGVATKESVRQRMGGEAWLGSLNAKDGDDQWYSKRVSFWMRQYEDFVGLTEVKASQASVVALERKFIGSQDARRETQSRLNEVQQKVKEIHAELEKTHRGEDKYLTLVTQEHQILKEERQLLHDLSHLERTERECFTALSSGVRDSHEKERAQAEKTKYWSLLGSVLGTCIGIIGTTINNRLRMRELRELVTKSASGERLVDLTEQMDKSFVDHKRRMNELIARVEGVVTNAQDSQVKFGEVRTISEALRAVSEQINTRDIETSLDRLSKGVKEDFKEVLAQNNRSQQLLHSVHSITEDLPSASFLERLVLERLREANESITSNTDSCRSAILSNFEEISKSNQAYSEELLQLMRAIDSRVNELGTILKKLQLASIHRRKKERELLESLDESLLDKIDNALEEHASKIRNHMSKWAWLFVVATPIVVCVAHQLLK